MSEECCTHDTDVLQLALHQIAWDQHTVVIKEYLTGVLTGV